MALIQGPPGTGKTFLGIQIVRVLVSNLRSEAHPLDMSGHSRPPVLVMCLTNHALDQFLEGLLSAGVEGIVRVGSRWGGPPQTVQDLHGTWM